MLDAIKSNRRRIALGVLVFFLVILAELLVISLIFYSNGSYAPGNLRLHDRTFDLERFLPILLIALGATAVLTPAFAAWAYFWGKNAILNLFWTMSLSEADQRKLKIALEGVSIAAGAKKPQVMVMDLGGVNAFSLAKGYKEGLILVTRGAVENLDRRELEALLAHELYHIMAHDTWLWMLGLGMSAFLPLVLALPIQAVREHGGWVVNLRLVLLVGLFYIFFYMTLAVFWVPLWLAFYLLVLPRNRDELADAWTVMITRDPEAVASLLRKADIMRSESLRHGALFINHMFFNQPLEPARGLDRKIYDLFDRHQAASQREASINGMG